MHQVVIENNFTSWRSASRSLLAREIPPEQTMFADSRDGELLPMLESLEIESPKNSPRVPADFIAAAKLASCFRDSNRWHLLFKILWRLTHGESHLLEIATDDDVVKLSAMIKAVRRDRHKMTAFVRFRKVIREEKEFYVAWHRPDHYIVRLTAPFFRDRFASLNWTILTPDESVNWDGEQLKFSPGVPRRDAPLGDDLEDLWKTYYANIFNPARIKLNAMRAEMPKKHWATLPETQLIDQMLRDAPARIEAMMKHTAKMSDACENTGSAADFLPATITLPQLREASKTCRGCSLYCTATQTVFGEGPSHASVMFVGEQPGDQEDLAGKPFVGPAGAVFDDGIEEAGIPRDQVYITNAVKHFKFEPRGKRRIHAKPNAREVKACRPWLENEIAVIKPKIVVALGATAAQSLMGSGFRLLQNRGQFFNDTPWAPNFIATLHPSALLRIPDPQMKAQAQADFLSDLKLVARQMRHTAETS